MKNTIPFRHRAIPFVLQTLAWFPTSVLVTVFLHFKSSGREHVREAFRLAKERGVGVLFCANHVSELDPILILFGTGPFSRAFPMFFVIYTPSTYKDVALFGWRAFLYGELFFKCWGAHALIAGQKDYAVALAPHVPILNAGYSLTMFPEGKFSKTGEPLPAKGGTGYLALKTGAVILPVKISGIAAMTNSDFWLGRRKCVVSYGSPYSYSPSVETVDDPERCKQVAVEILNKVTTI